VGLVAEWALLANLSPGAADDEDDDDDEEEGRANSENGESGGEGEGAASSRSRLSPALVECFTCGSSLGAVGKVWTCPPCGATSHVCCLALASLAFYEAPRAKLVPKDGRCDGCGFATAWGNVVLGVKDAGR
jgi:hypothetical protein